jgi:hypothetical protein
MPASKQQNIAGIQLKEPNLVPAFPFLLLPCRKLSTIPNQMAVLKANARLFPLEK